MTTLTRTDQVLAAMLTENTGRSILDSGDAYGRNWQRNQGRDAESFLAAPAITLDVRFGYIDVTLDLFHWLRDRLDYDEDLDTRFREFADEREDTYWLQDMEDFLAKTGTPERGFLTGTYNSYNSECLLSQTIQFAIGEDEDGESYVLLQIHGGCDVRGGYTAPRAFRPSTSEITDLVEWNCYELYCTAEPPQTEMLPGMPESVPHHLSFRSEWIHFDGSFDTDPWDGREPVVEPEDADAYVACPHCGATMEVGEYPVG
jgi:hypothetical protein